MELWGLPKARPITCSDCPAFHRLHSSVRCAGESATRFPWVIRTTLNRSFILDGVASTHLDHHGNRTIGFQVCGDAELLCGGAKSAPAAVERGDEGSADVGEGGVGEPSAQLLNNAAIRVSVSSTN